MLRARGPSWEKPETLQDPLNPQHEFLYAMVKGSNGKRFRVWCKCMSEYKNAGRYFNFDHITDVDSLVDGKKIYENHLRSATILIAVAKFHRKLNQS